MVRFLLCLRGWSFTGGVVPTFSWDHWWILLLLSVKSVQYESWESMIWVWSRKRCSKAFPAYLGYMSWTDWQITVSIFTTIFSLLTMCVCNVCMCMHAHFVVLAFGLIIIILPGKIIYFLCRRYSWAIFVYCYTSPGVAQKQSFSMLTKMWWNEFFGLRIKLGFGKCFSVFQIKPFYRLLAWIGISVSHLR